MIVPYTIYMKYMLFFAFAVSVVMGWGGAFTNAQSSAACHHKTSFLDTEEDFAPVVHMFSQVQELLITILCNTDQTVEVIIAGESTTPVAVWEKAFILTERASVDEENVKEWEEITLTGEKDDKDSEWITGRAAGDIPADMIREGVNYLAVYACSWFGGEWKCGCTDTSCTGNNYILQSFGLDNRTDERAHPLEFGMDPDGRDAPLPIRTGRVVSKLLYRGPSDQKHIIRTYDVGEPFTLTRTVSRSSFTGMVASLEWRSSADSCLLTARSAFEDEYTWLSEPNLVKNPPPDFIPVPYRPFNDTTFVFSALPGSGHAHVLLPMREVYTTSDTARELVALDAVPTVYTIRCADESASLTGVSEQIAVTLDLAGVVLEPDRENLQRRGYYIIERLGGSGVPRVDIKTAVSGGSVLSVPAPCAGCTSFVRTTQVFSDTTGTIACRENGLCTFFTLYTALNADRCSLNEGADLGTHAWVEEVVISDSSSGTKEKDAVVVCEDEGGLTAMDVVRGEER